MIRGLVCERTPAVVLVRVPKRETEGIFDLLEIIRVTTNVNGPKPSHTEVESDRLT